MEMKRLPTPLLRNPFTPYSAPALLMIMASCFVAFYHSTLI